MKKERCQLVALAGFVACALALSSCHDSTKSGALTVDSLKYDSVTAAVDCKLSVTYPVEGEPALLSSVREYLSESLGDLYKGEPGSAKEFTDFYGQCMFDSLAREASAFEMPSGASYVYYGEVEKTAEGEKFVTFETSVYSYLGGAHGSTVFTAATFRKSDGRKFGEDMLKDRYSQAFTEAIKSGLMRYFKVQSEMDLESCLLGIKTYAIPLPQNPPYFTAEGLTFTYQQYEIAPYAAGMPTFTIPFSQARPFLIRAAADLIP